MGPLDAIRTGFARSFQFRGRSARSEYWWFYGFTIVGIWIAVMADAHLLGLYELGTPMRWTSLGGLFSIATLPAILAVGFRRLQDTNLDGLIYVGLTLLSYLQIFSSAPLVQYPSVAASLAMILLCIRKSNEKANSFGPNPKEVPS